MAIANTGSQLRQKLILLIESGYSGRIDFFRQYIPAFEGYNEYRLDGNRLYQSFYAETRSGVFKKLEKTEVTTDGIPFESCEDWQREYIDRLMNNALNRYA